MINVNQMTAAFSKMPDAALKQYAMMHKNDPYTMSLAMSESNRRKQMRQGAAPQGGQQPTVVDQELAQMGAPQMPQGQAQAMPEDSGIGALPQQPMGKAMAGGGIVAFDVGGTVDSARARQSAAQQALYTYGLRQRRADPQGFAAAQNEFNTAKEAVTTAQEAYAAELAGTGVEQAAMGLQDVGKTKQFLTASTPAPTDPNFRRPSTPGAIAAMPSIADQMKAQTAPAAAAPTVSPLSTLAPRVAAAPAAPAAPQKSYEDYFKASMETAGKEKNPFEQDTKNITATAKKGKEAELIAFRKDILAENAEMFKGQEARIGKREVALEKSKDTNTGMAFLQAGLAMMQARGPGLAGIAQGAGVGLGVYGAGLDKIKSAQEKLDESRDRIDELRRNKSSMDKREIRAKESGINDLVTQGERDLLAGKKDLYAQARALSGTSAASSVAVEQSGLDRAFKAQEGKLDRDSREKISSMPPAQMQMIYKLGEGDFKKGYEIYKQEAAIPRLYESYTKQAADPFKGAEFQAKYPDFQTYMAGSGMMGGGGGKIMDTGEGAAGPMRTR